MKLLNRLFLKFFREPIAEVAAQGRIDKVCVESSVSESAKMYPPYQITKSSVGDFTYISHNSKIFNTQIGKFCSIGPNLISGWGIHPTDGISTHPMFYSTGKQNGMTLSATDKIEETKPISIGHDVFIGMNVLILDGVTIGNGAVIGAGSVVSKDIPPYAIAVGSPIKVIRLRQTEENIQKLQKIEWWNFDFDQLKDVETHFFDIDAFIKKYDGKNS